MKKNNNIENLFLIAFEGMDGAGKSTQARLTHLHATSEFGEKFDRILHMTQPTSPVGGEFGKGIKSCSKDLGAAIRRRLKQPHQDTEVLNLLFAADRLEQTRSLQRGFLDCTDLAILDRTHYSGKAYPGKQHTVDVVEPDLLIYLDITAENALTRILGRGVPLEYGESLSAMIKVGENYKNVLPNHTVWVDVNNKTQDEVNAIVQHIVNEHVNKYLGVFS